MWELLVVERFYFKRITYENKHINIHVVHVGAFYTFIWTFKCIVYRQTVKNTSSPIRCCGYIGNAYVSVDSKVYDVCFCVIFFTQ